MTVANLRAAGATPGVNSGTLDAEVVAGGDSLFLPLVGRAGAD